MWKKGLWIYNASSSREFNVDDVNLRAEWQVGLRFSRNLLKAGDPRRNQGPFCIEYLALKDAEGSPIIEYHGDRSPLQPPHVSSLIPKSHWVFGRLGGFGKISKHQTILRLQTCQLYCQSWLQSLVLESHTLFEAFRKFAALSRAATPCSLALLIWPPKIGTSVTEK